MNENIEKQAIEEMVKDIDGVIEFKILGLKDAFIKVRVSCERIAERLYNAGYRKQSVGEWVTVYRNDIATVYECSRCKHLTFGTSEYCICGARMKGGAE